MTLALISDHCSRIPVPEHVNLVHFPLLTVFVVKYASLVPDTANREKKTENDYNQCKSAAIFGLLLKFTHGVQDLSLIHI